MLLPPITAALEEPELEVPFLGVALGVLRAD